MEETIHSLEKWGYILLFIYSLGGGFVGLIAAGVMSALGKFDLYFSMLIAAFGNALGSSLLAFLARYQKNEIASKLTKHRRKIALAHSWLKKYGSWLIVFSKYLYGIKTIVPLSIGFTRFSLKKFIFINLFACALWAVIVGFVGFYASALAIALLDYIEGHSYIVPLVLLPLFGLILYALHRFSQKIKKDL